MAQKRLREGRPESDPKVTKKPILVTLSHFRAAFLESLLSHVFVTLILWGFSGLLGVDSLHRSGPKCLCGTLHLHPPCALGSLPHTNLGRPLPEHCKKSTGVVGKREEVGREGLWLEGRALELQ